MNINTDPGCYKWGSRYGSILPLDGGCFCSFLLWVHLVAPAVMWRREGQFLNILNDIYFFPCLGSFSEWPPKLESVKRQQCKLCSVEGRKKESEVAQLCPTLCHSMDCSLPVSSIHGIFQARILEWITISFSRGYSQWKYRLLEIGWSGKNVLCMSVAIGYSWYMCEHSFLHVCKCLNKYISTHYIENTYEPVLYYTYT